MWVEPDLNMPEVESILRQLLVGQREAIKLYGVTTRIGWNPDTFGYNWQFRKSTRSPAWITSSPVARSSRSAQPRGPQRRLRARADCRRFGGEERRGGDGVMGGAASGSGLVTVATAGAGAANRRGAHAGNHDRAASGHCGGQYRAAEPRGRTIRCHPKREARAGNWPGAYHAGGDAGICPHGGPKRSVPIVLDADGLNAFAGRASELKASAGCWP